jgi:hypothetical protein
MGPTALCSKNVLPCALHCMGFGQVDEYNNCLSKWSNARVFGIRQSLFGLHKKGKFLEQLIVHGLNNEDYNTQPVKLN